MFTLGKKRGESEKDHGKNDRHRRKFSLSFGVNEPQRTPPFCLSRMNSYPFMWQSHWSNISGRSWIFLGPESAMVLVSCFGDLFAGYTHPFFHYAPIFLHQLITKNRRITKKNGHIIKKRVPVTSKVPRNPQQEPLLKTVMIFLRGTPTPKMVVLTHYLANSLLKIA